MAHDKRKSLAEFSYSQSSKRWKHQDRPIYSVDSTANGGPLEDQIMDLFETNSDSCFPVALNMKLSVDNFSEFQCFFMRCEGAADIFMDMLARPVHDVVWSGRPCIPSMTEYVVTVRHQADYRDGIIHLHVSTAPISSEQLEHSVRDATIELCDRRGVDDASLFLFVAGVYAQLVRVSREEEDRYITHSRTFDLCVFEQAAEMWSLVRAHAFPKGDGVPSEERMLETWDSSDKMKI